MNVLKSVLYFIRQSKLLFFAIMRSATSHIYIFVVDTIESNVERAENYVEAGNTQLIQAASYQVKYL